MEVAAILLLIIFGCIISFFISYFGFYRKTQSGRLFLSIITCLALGYISPWIIGGIGYIPTIISQYKIGSNTQKEVNYLASALAGEFSDREIKEHYLAVQLNGNDLEKMRSFLYEVTQSNPSGQLPGIRRKIKPETLPVLVDIFQNQSEIIGLLAGYRDAPYPLKLKVSNAIEPSAVKYLARSVDTPSDILVKLASHPSRDVAESAVHTINWLVERKRLEKLHGNGDKNNAPILNK